MKLTKKQRILKYAVYVVIILAFHLLQNVLLAGGSVRCFFLIPVCILLGMNEDEKSAALLGLFGGLLWDSVSAQHRGFHAVCLMLLCYFTAATVVFLFRNTFAVGAVLAVSGTFIHCLVYWLCFVLLKSSEGAGTVLAGFYLPSALITAVLTPLLYGLVIPLKDWLNHERQLEGVPLPRSADSRE